MTWPHSAWRCGGSAKIFRFWITDLVDFDAIFAIWHWKYVLCKYVQIILVCATIFEISSSRRVCNFFEPPWTHVKCIIVSCLHWVSQKKLTCSKFWQSFSSNYFFFTHHSCKVCNFSCIWHTGLKLHTQLNKSCIYHVWKYFIVMYYHS